VGPRRICDIYDFFAPHINVLTYLLYLLTDGLVIGNESAPIHLAQCRFPGLAIPDAKILILFFKQNTRKQFYQTALGNCYGLKLPKCRLQFKKGILLCHLLQFLAHFRFLCRTRQSLPCHAGQAASPTPHRSLHLGTPASTTESACRLLSSGLGDRSALVLVGEPGAHPIHGSLVLCKFAPLPRRRPGGLIRFAGFTGVPTHTWRIHTHTQTRQ